MNRKFKGLKHLWVAAALAAVVVLAGCSNDSIVGPVNDQDVLLGRSIPVVPLSAVEVSQQIPAATGGVIAISQDNYNHAFVVSKDGLDKDETISAKVQSDYVNGKKAVIFEFGPDGLVFKEASKLQFDIAAVNVRASSAYLYYFDPKVGNWVLQSVVRVNNGVAVFDINHFSKYAISD